MAVIPHLFEMDMPFHLMERQLMRPDHFFGISPLNQLVRRECNPREYRPWHTALRPRDSIIRPLEQLSNAMTRLAVNELGKISTDDEKFQVNIDVQHFSPEEIDVKVIDGHVVVEGKHEEKQDNHGFVSRQFVRRYALPEGCLPDTVESKLSSDGVLTVMAPKVLPMPSIGERIVPIVHTGPVKKQLGSPTEPINEQN